MSKGIPIFIREVWKDLRISATHPKPNGQAFTDAALAELKQEVWDAARKTKDVPSTVGGQAYMKVRIYRDLQHYEGAKS